MKVPEILLVESAHKAGNLALVLGAIGNAGVTIDDIRMVSRSPRGTLWEITVELDEGLTLDALKGIDALPTARIVGTSDRVFKRHEGGKIRTISTNAITSLNHLRDLYTPGVARVCLAIQKDPEKALTYTNLNRTVAIVTNGTAILGLGHIGAVPGLPVMEGKAALMAQLADLSGVPILIESEDSDLIVETVCAIAPSFGAIQLEDIRAPECFDIEERLVQRLDRPVMHDDQHGTATVALAALLSAARMAKASLADSVVGQVGLGAAGIGISRLLLHTGVKRLLGADTNPDALQRLGRMGGEATTLSELMKRADIVISCTGVRGLIKPEMVRRGQIILALSNPEPEIEPEVALAQGAAYAADGKSVNNVLGFPGIFRGALEAHARVITEKMLVAASRQISAMAGDGMLVPDPLDRRVHDAVAQAVKEAART